jgi:hypothetical protein
MCRVDYPTERIKHVMDAGIPRRPYRSRNEGKAPKQPDELRATWGQRKLFMTEVHFLTEYGHDGDTVVYAGAAPGTHIPLLAELFPRVTFVLVDPAPFDPALRSHERVQTRNDLMDDQLASQFAGRDDVLFLSDIRRTHAHETCIAEDMRDQERWHLFMQPRASMLKFRLPWSKGSTEYLDGAVYFQPYVHARSTETRLVVTVGLFHPAKEQAPVAGGADW